MLVAVDRALENDTETTRWAGAKVHVTIMNGAYFGWISVTDVTEAMIYGTNNSYPMGAVYETVEQIRWRFNMSSDKKIKR